MCLVGAVIVAWLTLDSLVPLLLVAASLWSLGHFAAGMTGGDGGKKR